MRINRSCTRAGEYHLADLLASRPEASKPSPSLVMELLRIASIGASPDVASTIDGIALRIGLDAAPEGRPTRTIAGVDRRSRARRGRVRTARRSPPSSTRRASARS
jgi:hypothetical protein